MFYPFKLFTFFGVTAELKSVHPTLGQYLLDPTLPAITAASHLGYVSISFTDLDPNIFCPFFLANLRSVRLVGDCWTAIFKPCHIFSIRLLSGLWQSTFRFLVLNHFSKALAACFGLEGEPSHQSQVSFRLEQDFFFFLELPCICPSSIHLDFNHDHISAFLFSCLGNGCPSQLLFTTWLLLWPIPYFLNHWILVNDIL